MCVIVVCPNTRPSSEMVEKCWQANPDGAGIAYREGEGSNTVVRWKKGLSLAKIKDEIEAAPFPFVAHFRIASVGKVVPNLTHPFPVHPKAPLDLAGTTKGHVLFHNGTWTKWRDETWIAAARFKAKIPAGRWSDTRAMAFLSYFYGPGLLDFIEEKGVLFGPSDLELFNGISGWSMHEGCYISNTFFKDCGTTGYVGGHGHWNSGFSYVSEMCKWKQCVRKDIDSDGYCPEHQSQKPEWLVKKATPTQTLTTVGTPTSMAFDKDGKHIGSAGPGTNEAAVKVLTEGKTGGSSPTGPFSVELAETMYRMGRISKSTLRQIRKCFSNQRPIPPKLFTKFHQQVNGTAQWNKRQPKPTTATVN